MQGGITKSELAAALWGEEGLGWQAKDLEWGEHKINNIELKQGHLRHFHVSKEVPFGGDHPHQHMLSGKSACWGASLKCLYTNAHSIGNKHEEICG